MCVFFNTLVLTFEVGKIWYIMKKNKFEIFWDFNHWLIPYFKSGKFTRFFPIIVVHPTHTPL